MSKQVQITKEGLEVLKKELATLLEEKRPELVERLAFARTQGDLSENSDYQDAKNELEFLDGRIQELNYVIETAIVVSENHSGEVTVGTKVILKANGAEHIFDIVGEWESDPVEKKISLTSPLGSALVGKKVGEKVEVEAPAGKITYEILKIG